MKNYYVDKMKTENLEWIEQIYLNGLRALGLTKDEKVKVRRYLYAVQSELRHRYNPVKKHHLIYYEDIVNVCASLEVA